MPFCSLPDMRLHYLDQGPKDGPAVVFSNALGTTTAMWDLILPHLPSELRIIRYDMRGHGLSDVTCAPYSMGTLIKDVEGLIDHLNLQDVTCVGLSIGGVVTQGLAVKRPDIIKAMVLSNTGTKIGTRKIWEDLINATHRQGMSALAPHIIDRLFSPKFKNTEIAKEWQSRISECNVDGYTGCMAALQGTDFITPTSTLTIPTLCISGGMDMVTPADMVHELSDLIDGAIFKVLPNSGHLPPLDTPERYASILTDFLIKVAHNPK